MKITNARAWAIGSQVGNRLRIRRIVWGRLLAREEKQENEVIERVVILVMGKTNTGWWLRWKAEEEAYRWHTRKKPAPPV